MGDSDRMYKRDLADRVTCQILNVQSDLLAQPGWIKMFYAIILICVMPPTEQTPKSVSKMSYLVKKSYVYLDLCMQGCCSSANQNKCLVEDASIYGGVSITCMAACMQTRIDTPPKK